MSLNTATEDMNRMAIMSWECKTSESRNLSVRNLFDNLPYTVAKTNVSEDVILERNAR